MPTRHATPYSRHPRCSLIAHLVMGTLLAPVTASAQQAPAQVQQQAAKPAAAAQAQAQAAPAPAAVPAPSVESTVTVSATRTQNRIDRQSYDVKADPATSNDTVAGTLNKVPAVAVDADGNVTLRGRNNVQILVDGKPSAMMQGENRAAALNALPAGDLESVEVINNPGAQFGNEGGGGPVINLVMRRERSPGGFGAINANVGSGGRYNTNAFGSYTQGRYSVQGSVFRRQDKRETSGETRRERIDLGTGIVDVVLARHLVADELQQVRQRIAEHRTPTVTDMHRAGRIGRDVFDVDLFAVAAVGAAIRTAALQDRRQHVGPD